MNGTNDTNEQPEGSPPEDMALATLLAVAAETAPDFPREIIERVYAIQKRHQFDTDRSASSQEMQRLLEAHIDRAGNGGAV
jgi:hypothetical protein